MLRYLVIFFVVPIGLFWAWFGLSYHDINFGLIAFTRMFHDIYFAQMAEMLGIPADTIPMAIAKACVIDFLFIMAVFAFRRRREIGAWWSSRVAASDVSSLREADQAPPAE